MKAGRLERAISTLYRCQTLSDTKSHIADIDPRALLGVTLVYLVAILSVDVTRIGMLIWFAVYPIVTAPLAHIAYERLFVKSLYVLPLLVVIAAFNPVYDHRTVLTIGNFAVSVGWVTFFSILIRGLLSVQALLLLIYVAGFNRICAALASFKVPAILVTQMLLIYRYMIVLMEEALTMKRARIARGYGRKSFGLKDWGAFVGQLLLRTFARAERVHRCMLARGFAGALPVAVPPRWQTSDTVYCMVWIPVLAVLRFADISSFFVKFAL